MKKIKILFVLDSLGLGGAQSVILNILKYIDRNKFNAELAFFDSEGDYMDNLPEDITYHDLNAVRTRYMIFSLTRLLREIKPQIIFSTLFKVNAAINVAVKLAGLSPKVILRSSNFLSSKFRVEPFYTNILARWANRNANSIVATTEEMRSDMYENFHIPFNKIKVIYNPVDIKFVDEMSHKSIKDSSFEINSRKNYPLIISMGRLANQKGYSYLLRAFQMVRNKLPARLVILGRGDKKEELENLARNLNIDEYVTFLGFQSNPYGLIARCDLFVLSSLWEGFPNALIEAMTCGIPVISTDCSSGPKEIITSGVNGLLVPVGNVNILANAIISVLTDKKLSNKIAKNGRKRVMDFEAEKVVKEYEKLFISTMNKSKI